MLYYHLWNSSGTREKQQPILPSIGSFEEAKTVFDDPLYVDFYDPDHSFDGHRYIIIGESHQRRVLIISYMERDNIIRLISAREVTRSERETYEEG